MRHHTTLIVLPGHAEIICTCGWAVELDNDLLATFADLLHAGASHVARGQALAVLN